MNPSRSGTLILSTAAFILAAPPLSANAQSKDELQNEIRAMKQRLETLESQLQTLQESSASTAQQASQTQTELYRLNMQNELAQTQLESSGWSGLKISGFIDPVYIYNQRQDTAGFVFMKDFADVNGSGEHPSQRSTYNYDNAFFGSALIRFEKQLEDGSLWLLELMPHKSMGDGGGYNLGSIVSQAYAILPLDENSHFLAGQFGSWFGYENLFSGGESAKKTITNNLLFDFTEPVFISGIGYQYSKGDATYKAIIGGASNGRVTDRKGPVLHWRTEYTLSEFSGWNLAGMHGKASADSFQHYIAADAYFIRGDLSLQAQLEAGRLSKAAFNGGTAKWLGWSGLAAYKLNPRTEALFRLDYLYNRANGGGLPGIGFVDGCAQLLQSADPSGSMSLASACGDYRNGFGPGIDNQTGLISDPTRGANRYALSVGLNYALLKNTMLKFELRYDRSDQNSFYDVPSGSYKKDNFLFGASTVVSF